MGPLSGKTVIEFAGLGPGPYAGMMLADMGAKVVRVERPGGQMMTAGVNPKYDVHNRGKNCICINMKSAEGIACAKKLIGTADALIEGYRPGVMEKLGLGPDVCLEINPKLVYGRMTGWGQTGPLANAAGHDINYIALTGVLHGIGRKGEKPAIPLNVVGDYGGGGMMLAFGLVCALLETQQSGQGQVVDCSIVDGVASLMGFFYSQLQVHDLPQFILWDYFGSFQDRREGREDRLSIGENLVQLRLKIEHIRLVSVSQEGNDTFRFERIE